jgi:ABC-2 type transport system permease protein
MRSVLALARAAWLTAVSYRLATLLSFAAVLASIVPIYFIADAVQGVAAASIRQEGGDYFGFIVFGLASVYIVSAAVSAVPGALAGSIGNGTFEALLVTRTSWPAILLGLAAYPAIQAALRATVLLASASVLGVEFRWAMAPAVLVIVALTVAAYAGVGLVAGASILVFRTAGPLIPAVIGLSGLLGGAYYATSVVPGWLQSLTHLIPLSYALRASRMLLMGGASIGEVTSDVQMLALFAAALLALGGGSFLLALSRAQRTGTLSQY